MPRDHGLPNRKFSKCADKLDFRQFVSDDDGQLAIPHRLEDIQRCYMVDNLGHSRCIFLWAHHRVQEEGNKRRHDRHCVLCRSILHGCAYSYAQRSGRTIDPEYKRDSSRPGRDDEVRPDGVSKTDALPVQVLLAVRRDDRDNLDLHAAHDDLQEEVLLL